MAHLTIFSVVVAELSGELNRLFQSDFDFKDIVTKICHDAGVRIYFENTSASTVLSTTRSRTSTSTSSACFKLQGVWHAMEQAHKQMTAALVDKHGDRPVADLPDAESLSPHSDKPDTDKPATQPSQKGSSARPYDRCHPVESTHGESEDGRSDKTPHSDDSGDQASRSLFVPDIDNTETKMRQRPSRSHDIDKMDTKLKQRPLRSHIVSSKKPPSKKINRKVREGEQMKPKQRSRRITSCKKTKRALGKKKQIANDFQADFCRDNKRKCGSHDTEIDLNVPESNKQHENPCNAKNEDISSSEEASRLNPPCNSCDHAEQRNLLKTIEDNESKTLSQPRNTERKRSRKSLPRQLLAASHKYSFFSKYKCRSYTSKLTTIHNGKAVVPASTNIPDSALKQRLSEKYEQNKCTNFSCPDCKFVTVSRSKLMDHIHGQHKGSPVCCDLCGKIFYSKTNLLRHRTSHRGPQHCCDVCGKMFKIQKAMINHRKTHDEGYTKPSVPCKLCEKTFCSQYIVDCHVRSFHLGQRKSYICSFCGKKFTTKHSLQEHANAHTGNKPHVCEICGKGFSYESALRDHKFTHDDVKQFNCDVCNKTFCQRSGLKMHLRIHKAVKQFQCPECGREFTQKQALQRHERVHKGVKPFTCRLCSRSFSDASVVRRHLTLVHKIHKDAKSWREDIVSTVQPDLDFHVSLVGVRESDRHPDKSCENKTRSQTYRASQTKTHTGKLSKKKTVSEKETHAVNSGHEPKQSVSQPNHSTNEGDFPSNPSSCGSDLSLSGKIEPQGSTASQNVSKNALQCVEDLPRVSQGQDSASIQFPYPDLSVDSVSVVDNHPPMMTALCRCQRRCSSSAVCCSTVEGAATLPSMKKSVDSSATIQTTLQSPLIRSNTVGESCPQHHHHHLHGMQSAPPCSKESSCTVALASATTTATCTLTPTGFNTTTVTVQQPWSSLYYYSQLASQFGMTLSDHPYVAAATSHTGGTASPRPSSPVAWWSSG